MLIAWKTAYAYDQFCLALSPEENKMRSDAIRDLHCRQATPEEFLALQNEEDAKIALFTAQLDFDSTSAFQFYKGWKCALGHMTDYIYDLANQ